MTNKEIKITVPDGYEIDKENSTFECIKFKKKGLAYKDVCDALFAGKVTYYCQTIGKIGRIVAKGSDVYSPNNATSEYQVEQLLAFNQLMNVARYLNEGTVDWDNDGQVKCFIYYDHFRKTLGVGITLGIQEATVYFDSEEHAKQAIEILGEKTVKKALGVFE